MPTTRSRDRKGVSPCLIAIVGGSGSGKSWLAEKLEGALAPHATRLSLDDFYRDRSHLSPARRARLNFDHPRAIDWQEFERTLKALKAGRAGRVPQYDFAEHCRMSLWKILEPKPILLVDGLWLLRRPAVRRLFSWAIFLECPAKVRLQRRLGRDQLRRGRTAASVRQQFQRTVEPMHQLYVAPQGARADLVLRRACSLREIDEIVGQVRKLAGL